MKVENWIEFEYHGKPRQGEVRIVKTAKEGHKYAVCNVVDLDVKEIVIRSFKLKEMKDVKVVKSC